MHNLNVRDICITESLMVYLANLVELTSVEVIDGCSQGEKRIERDGFIG